MATNTAPDVTAGAPGRTPAKGARQRFRPVAASIAYSPSFFDLT
ncbi:hypothetical protein JIW86_02015 [Streptomyces sp. NBC_00162]|nr:hypothetical protein [Streptomyces sp. NBC_00162]UUU37784.1 hypothetical protein JIW86_02015 [Streptomyces sp. NBC_00162]